MLIITHTLHTFHSVPNVSCFYKNKNGFCCLKYTLAIPVLPHYIENTSKFHSKITKYIYIQISLILKYTNTH